MANYVIGDIHGCYDQLIKLLNFIHFSATKDTLWFTGDLINRGPKSLEVLRFISSLPRVNLSLGNHDFRLLLHIFTQIPCSNSTLATTLAAPDILQLGHWLRKQPVIYYHKAFNTLLLHAGLPPQWSLEQAIGYAKEIEKHLQSEQYIDFLVAMAPYYESGNSLIWHDNLSTEKRLAYILNAFTRIRFCNAQGTLDLKTKANNHPSSEYLPWFQLTPLAHSGLTITFGHWAALHGKTGIDNIYALDTGCERGCQLTALCLENKKLFSVPCP